MSTPPYDYLGPAVFTTQDLKDDDPAVIDSLVQETNAPADLKYGVEPYHPVPQYKPNPITRLFTATVLLSGGADPYQLLPEDVNRITCKLSAYSTNATPANITYNDFCLVGDNRGLVSARSNTFLCACHHLQERDLYGHTGALWVIPGPGMTAAIEVTAWAVTTYDR
jgi:hypothetical protein